MSRNGGHEPATLDPLPSGAPVVASLRSPRGMGSLLPPLLALALLVTAHAVTPALRFLQGVPRNVWLSVFGGIAVSYVFVHLLPELAAAQEQVGGAVVASGLEGGVAGLRFGERHVYLIALVGLSLFYGLDRLAKHSRAARAGGRASDAPADPDAPPTSLAVFWVHMASFGVYNALVGYLLLHREQPGTASLAFYTVAMALHFVVTDFGLNEDHQARFRAWGRWLLALALGAGFALGSVTELSRAAVGVLISFLAGGVILNVLKEEMPSERQSRFWAFAAGAAGYAALLLTF